MATTANLAPGVTWKAESPAPTEALSTGIVGFLGLTCKQLLDAHDRALLQAPVRLTLFGQLAQRLGSLTPDACLIMAVKSFFANGGTECWVVLQVDTLPTTLDASLELLKVPERVDLICAPFVMDPQLPLSWSDRYQLQERMLDACLKERTWFAILDGPAGDATLQTVVQQQDRLKAHPGAMNAALYYPWVNVVGSCLACQGTGWLSSNVCATCNGSGNGFIPPSGSVAGIYAQVDRRVGVFAAPANQAVQEALDLETSLSNADQAALNQAGINCLRAFPGRGIRIWGARTLCQNPLWLYVNVRRLFLTVGRSLEQLAASAVFEPNDLSLWIRLSRELNAWLLQLFFQGALKGRTPEEAFYVKCDAETNPPDVRDRGELVIELGLAPATPGEFIVIRVMASSEGVQLGGTP